jgi:hypothetical protein
MKTYFELKIATPYTNGWLYFYLILNPLFQFRWFTDCGDWFLYIHICKYYVRFSSAGFKAGKVRF